MRRETVTLREHLEVLREADDRRYAEVAAARAEALKIKEEADKTALGLQRDYQIYKDEKANELREQISSERGMYATKDDLAAAIREVIASRTQGNDRTTTYILAVAAIAVAVLVGHPFG